MKHVECFVAFSKHEVPTPHPAFTYSVSFVRRWQLNFERTAMRKLQVSFKRPGCVAWLFCSWLSAPKVEGLIPAQVGGFLRYRKSTVAMSYHYTACKRSLECLFGLDALGKIKSGYRFASSESRCLPLERKMGVKFTSGTWYPPIGRRTKKGYKLLGDVCSGQWSIDSPLEIKKTTRGLLATDHVILNHGQETWTTPELAAPSPNYRTTPREDVSALDRFNVHRCPTGL
ncbi:hypothetical protein TNCV_42571 [Trichonephila clavipes]|nr:hypothetical protein TNCV_42571 [Trichonephila clavipes]